MKRIPIFLIITALMACLLGGCRTNHEAVQESPGSSVQAAPTVTPTEVPKGPYVAFSADSGFYDSAFELTLSCDTEGAVIYYTLDGSTPDSSSAKYTEPLRIRNRTNSTNLLSAQKHTSADNFYLPKQKVEKATVLRAIAYLPDGSATPISHATYFVSIDREAAYGDLPVISLITDFKNLYDYETGIYVLGKTHEEWLAEDSANASLAGWQMMGNYTNSGKDWERPVSVEFLGKNGSAGFRQDMGIRIMGGASRNHPQKSLKLIAREEYGKKSLKFDLIPDNLRSDGTGAVTKYKSFVLRNGGNDADFARVRDPFLQGLVADCSFETQESTPCIAYINGEFWGIYSITEDYSDNYFENNYDVDNKNVILIKCGEMEDGEESDLDLFHDMYDFITSNDMSDPVMYEAAGDLLDLGSFVDYFAFELYVANEDSIFEDNNWRMWRVRECDNTSEWMDGRWRMIAYDTDYSTGIYSGVESAATDNISPRLHGTARERISNKENYHPIELFRSLMENEQFRKEVILALCDMRNIYFEPKRAVAYLDEIAAPYLTLMPENYKRFGPDWIANQDTTFYITNQVKTLRSYMSKRYISITSVLRNAFDLDSPNKLTVKNEDTSFGTVLVNHRNTYTTGDYSGMYFSNLTLSLTAVPAEGYRFVRWETDSDAVTDCSLAEISFKMEQNTTVKAIFEKE